MKKLQQSLLKQYQSSPRLFGVIANHSLDPKTIENSRKIGEPNFFQKPVTGIIHNPSSLELHPTQDIIAEFELGIIISKPGSNIKQNEIFDHIGGFCVAGDLTATRYKPIPNFPDMFYRKVWDRLTPVSDFIEKSKIEDLDAAFLTLRHYKASAGGEGEDEYDEYSFTIRELIWSVQEQIEFISQRVEFRAGDMLLSGSAAAPNLEDGDRAVMGLRAEEAGEQLAEVDFLVTRPFKEELSE